MFSPSSAHTGTLYKYSRWVPHTAKYPKMPRKFSTSKERGTSWSGQQKDLSLAAHTAACSLFLALSPTVLSADQLWWLGKTRRWKVNSGEVVVLPPKFAGQTTRHQFVCAIQDKWRLLVKCVLIKVFLWLIMLEVGILLVLLRNFKVSVFKVTGLLFQRNILADFF